MPIFYTNTISSNVLQVSSSAIFTSSRGDVVKIGGSGSSIFSVTGSRGVLAEFSDLNSTHNNILVFSSGSVDILTIDRQKNVNISGSLIITGSLYVSGTMSVTGSSGVPTIDISSTNGGQIKFPATTNSSANVNTLDDYEEGSSTNVVAFSATSAVFSYASRYLTYTKIGRSCTVNIYLQLNTSGNTLNANALSITGLPFAALSTTGNGDVHVFFNWSSIATSMINMQGIITANSTTITMYKLTAAAVSLSAMASNDLSLTAGSQIRTTFTYTTAT